MKYLNNDYYQGEFKENLRDGYGKLKSKRLYYEGEFKKDKFHGIGMLKIEGNKYTGNFFEGL